MKTWWQRKTVGIEVVMMWVLGILVVSVFVLWATAGRAEVGWYAALPFVSDEKAMKEIIEEAARSGQTLHIHLYEFNEKTELWDRARPPACLERMETAMRDISPYIKKPRRPSGEWIVDGLTVCTGSCMTEIPGHWDGPPPPDTRSLEERLRQEQVRYDREQEERGKAIRDRAIEDWVFEQWESVKNECWRTS